jgi:hypothetical protein
LVVGGVPVVDELGVAVVVEVDRLTGGRGLVVVADFGVLLLPLHAPSNQAAMATNTMDFFMSEVCRSGGHAARAVGPAPERFGTTFAVSAALVHLGVGLSTLR